MNDKTWRVVIAAIKTWRHWRTRISQRVGASVSQKSDSKYSSGLEVHILSSGRVTKTTTTKYIFFIPLKIIEAIPRPLLLLISIMQKAIVWER